MSNGKGDKERPVDKKAWDRNFDHIDWSRYKCKCGHPKGGECLECPNIEIDVTVGAQILPGSENKKVRVSFDVEEKDEV